MSDNEKSGDGIRINISNSGIKSKIVGLTIIIVGLTIIIVGLILS